MLSDCSGELSKSQLRLFLLKIFCKKVFQLRRGTAGFLVNTPTEFIYFSQPFSFANGTSL